MYKSVNKYLNRDKRLSRGIRNNNPGNIVRNNIPWKGLCKVQTDERFCQFSSMFYGVRALAVLLHTYYYNHKLHTVEGIITRFAPSSENNTKVYIQFVKSVVYSLSNGLVDPDKPLDFKHVIWLVIPAITYFESHYSPTDSILSRCHSLVVTPMD